jgi:hypothetical protein
VKPSISASRCRADVARSGRGGVVGGRRTLASVDALLRPGCLCQLLAVHEGGCVPALCAACARESLLALLAGLLRVAPALMS